MIYKSIVQQYHSAEIAMYIQILQDIENKTSQTSCTAIVIANELSLSLAAKIIYSKVNAIGRV